MNKKNSLKPILQFVDFTFFYHSGQNQQPALDKINLSIFPNQITAVIGSSGCGKTTLLWTINRLSELQSDSYHVRGQIFFNGKPIYGSGIDVVSLRRNIGLVFQKPAPFPMSIYENIAFAIRIHNQNPEKVLDKIVEDSLKQVNLWEEVKDRLHESALNLSGGQQQRLCIARCLSNQPKIILMDEPTSALDPVSKQKLENLIFSLKKKYTIIIVTHSLNQASKVSDYVVFLEKGVLIEHGQTKHVFVQPKNKKTLRYITGRFD